jgi:hypothetical protein
MAHPRVIFIVQRKTLNRQLPEGGERALCQYHSGLATIMAISIKFVVAFPEHQSLYFVACFDHDIDGKASEKGMRFLCLDPQLHCPNVRVRRGQCAHENFQSHVGVQTRKAFTSVASEVHFTVVDKL